LLIARAHLHSEPSYYILTKMEADMSDEYLRRGSFFADVVFRGGHYGNMEIPGHIEDFQIIAKADEPFYLARTLPAGQKWRPPTKVPRFVDLPPLLKHMLVQEAREKRVAFSPDEIKLPFCVKTDHPFSLVTYE
jgi:hypothetical protein